MRKGKKILVTIFSVAAVAVLLAVIALCAVFNGNYSFSRSVSEEEQQLRMQVVNTAQEWLGIEEGSKEHGSLLDIYNTYEPLAQGYAVQPEDAWCATFVSAVSIQCGLTDILPTECSCQRQIELFRDLGSWEEADDYEPLPGDIIYYCQSDRSLSGDCTGWSDHVGIVVGTWHGIIKVIEGNYGDSVAYRYIPVDAPGIRGYALPNYTAT